VQVNLGMRRQEIGDGSALVSREVVSDHRDFFATRLIDCKVCMARGELGHPVCRAAGLPGTSPVLVWKAAYSDKVLECADIAPRMVTHVERFGSSDHHPLQRYKWHFSRQCLPLGNTKV